MDRSGAPWGRLRAMVARTRRGARPSHLRPESNSLARIGSIVSGIRRLLFVPITRSRRVIELLARLGWYPKPRDFAQMRKQDIAAYIHSIGMDAEIEAALREDAAEASTARADESLQPREVGAERRRARIA